MFTLLIVAGVQTARADSTVVFNEVMYHPPGTNEAALEWVELHNQMAVDMDISGWSLGGGIQFKFAEGTIVPGGGFLVVAGTPITLSTAGVANVTGPFTGRLANSGDVLELWNNNRRVMDVLEYGADGEWPVPPDGSGVSLAKRNPSGGTANVTNWTWSTRVGGTPGVANFPSSRPVTVVTNIMPITNAWRFHQGGTDLGTAWVQPGYDDSSWANGPALLAVESCGCLPEPIRTPLTLGQLTYYFRTRFTFDGDAAGVSLRLRHIIDDGAVVYLNGVEVWRVGMPAGAVSYATLASRAVGDGSYEGPITIPAAALLQGTNVLAVEVHQQGAGSSDIAFGLAVDAAYTIGGGSTMQQEMPSIAFNEVASATNGNFGIELINHGSNAVDITGYSIARHGGTNREYVLPAQSLPAGALLQIARAELGFGADPGDRLILYGRGKTNVLDGVVARRTHRARLPDGIGPWHVVTNVTPGASNVVTLRNEIVINEIMYDHVPIAATPAVYADSTVLVSITNVWRYNQEGVSLNGSAWREAEYNDSTWQTGAALHYVTTALLSAPKNTLLRLTNSAGARLVTWYFRVPFVFTGDLESAELNLRTIIDDGAVFYLNGVEVHRQNMPIGPIAYTNLASASVATPGFTGPFTVPTMSLVEGTNWLTAEVHQFTLNPLGADVVFGAELTGTALLSPAQPERDSPESWIELFNRGSNTVDLTGWEIDGGIDYAFQGIQLAPGEYLVLAKDPDHMRSLYPALNVIGPFDRSLSRSSDRITLRDVLGNVANEVRYHGSGRWPGYANRGGSSLELIDPRSDNSQAEAWAASDESLKSTWATYTYQGIAATEPATSPTTWREFVLGLLAAGEVLLDDISVIEAPTGAAVQLMQNGSFESGLTSWRILGSHQGTVITDPENPGNHVLHLRASGPTEHMHNHAETTLAGGVSVVNGREYRISFRAKWLAGNNNLHTRLYFNRLPRTTALNLPLLNGTPGARNSRYTANVGPTYTGFRHNPVVPDPATPASVSVKASDPDGVAAMTLWWTENGGVWKQAPMVAQAGGEHRGAIPGLPAATLVQFYVEGTDTRGAKSTFPAGGANSRALLRINDGQAIFDALHNVRILMTAADTARLHTPTNVMSNEDYGATVIYNEEQIFYNVRMHLQGSQRGRNDSSRLGFTIKFNPDELFRGVHDLISIDRSGGYSGRGGDHDEILFKHMINHAGGLPGMYDDLIHVIAPRQSENSTGLMLMAKYGDVFLDSQFASGADGSLHKLELIYFPLSTVDGNAQSMKLPNPDEVLSTDFTDLGNNKEAYRWTYLKENNSSSDEWDPMMRVAKTFALNGAPFAAQAERVLDVNEWLRAFAAESLFGVADTYGFGLPHNFMVYIRPEDGKAMAFLWDMDFGLYQGTTSAILPTGNVGKLLTTPANLRLYYSHLYDLITTTVNANYMSRWITHYGGLLNQNWSGARTYLTDRGNYVLGQLPTGTAFAITSNGGANFNVNSNLVAISGTAPIRVEYIEINGVRYPVRWTSTTGWTIDVPLAGGSNSLTVQAYDRYGRQLTNVADTITIVNNAAVPSPSGYVVVNEIHFHPVSAGEAFVEVHNIHPTVAFDLSNWQLDGADFIFPEGALIRAGGFVVVAANTNIFAQAFTNAPLPIGQYGGHLQNDGELLKLLRPTGTNVSELIDAVRYHDHAPWPDAADGGGSSLQLIQAVQDNTRPANWAAALPTPGATNSVAGTLAPFPGAWLNELLVFDTSGAMDNFGEREPWIEIYNNSSNTLSLAGMFLSDNPSNLTQWPFPAGASLGAKEFRIIWADNQPVQTSGTHFHTSFRPTNSSGLLFLSRTNAGGTEVLDAIEYFGLTPNRSFGSSPDGQPLDRQPFYFVTPGASNNPAATPNPVLINEFMADNAGPGGFSDPLDGLFQDWFELYNPNAEPFDLSGYYLTDNLTQPEKFQIPLNTVMAGHGYLLVWADNEPAQNGQSTLGDLHVNFQLSAGGESIGLFAPDGALLSSVTFGAQLENISMGLYPEGSTNGGYRYLTNFTARAANTLEPQASSFLVRSVDATAARVILTWDSVSGRTYRVQYKDNLDAPAWTQLGGDITATGAGASITNLAPPAQRFYRVMQVQ